MRVGDVLELLAAACFAAAAWVWFGVPAALVVVGVALAYEGQCFGSHGLPVPFRPGTPFRLKLPWRKVQSEAKE